MEVDDLVLFVLDRIKVTLVRRLHSSLALVNGSIGKYHTRVFVDQRAYNLPLLSGQCRFVLLHEFRCSHAFFLPISREMLTQNLAAAKLRRGRMVDEYLFIHDRVEDMIISGGENIYPTEIE